MLEKYLELTQISKELEKENKALSDLYLETDSKNQILEKKITEQDLLIADLILEKSRLKDLLIMTRHDLNEYLLESHS
jgi:hypothetical protein